jgi:hypothetical protein
VDALDGADTRIRTGDLPLTRRLLYQLSYAGMIVADPAGIACRIAHAF